MNRKLFVLLFIVLTASCAYAAITPEQAAEDSRIGPYIDYTKQNGQALLPGRYMFTQEIDQLGANQKVVAPTNLIVEIATMTALNPQQITYSLNADLWGEDEMSSMYMVLDFSGKVPVLKTYAADDGGQYEVITEDFAVVLKDSTKRVWCLASVETGEVRYMCPLDGGWFPKGWYSGNWKGQDGSSYTFSSDGTASMNGQVIGRFIVSDNRIVITRKNGSKELICAWWNPDTERLVLTFTNSGRMSAGAFTRVTEQTVVPVFPPASQKQEVPSTQQMPTQFPKMPDVKMPELPGPNIEGVWGAYVDGQQWITQYQGNQYYGWINGTPSEMGIITLKGNTMTGQNNKGVHFTAEIELDDSGQILTLTFPNGRSITYQKLQ
jgi:hypothetical protein